ncbi:uncharacterized protein LOC115974340 isoform X2 [Quercus lobata]|uniref:uncharacterized protein LOC115974340 isoform X2 n=1 Tax=Quercus lobata TaxID=97700 RepID=UPI00124494A7|nr:uncharacterized protein LOC115974340 isoform X2 [Quercus lobata]
MIHSYHSYSLGLNFGVQALGKSLKSQLNFPHKCPIGQIQMANTHNSIVSGCNSESRGALVVLEGLDRSGKTSQSSRLLTYLEGLGHSVELWRFPDRSTNVGQMISSYLSNKSQLDDHTIHLLFSANRWEKRSLMETKLKTGTTLIVDRYSYSGVAFSSAKGLGDEWCKAPEIGLLAPDLVFYLDIQPEKAAERGGYGDEKYERLEFQRKVSQCYQVLHDASWKIVDACQPIEDIEKQLQELVLECVMACQKGKPLANLWSGIDSKMHGDTCFTNPLQGVSNLENKFKMESPKKMGQNLNLHAQISTKDSPPQVEMELTAKKRGSNFTIEEDLLLISAWLNISLDVVEGNEQKHKSYWRRIWEYFHKNKTFISERTPTSITSRWSTIQNSTEKFCGYLAQVESMHQSGLNEHDKIGKAKRMYQESHKTPFQFDHCWNMLRCPPKWLEHCEKQRIKRIRNAITSSPSTPELTNIGQDNVSHDTFANLERPLDKRVKEIEILEKTCLQEQDQVFMKKEQEQKRIRMKKEQEQERLCIMQEKLQMEQLKEEERIIMMDTSSLSQIQQEYFHQRQMDILRNRRSK